MLEIHKLRVPGISCVDSKTGVDMPARSWYVCRLIRNRLPVSLVARRLPTRWMRDPIPCSQCKLRRPIPPKCREAYTTSRGNFLLNPILDKTALITGFSILRRVLLSTVLAGRG